MRIHHSSFSVHHSAFSSPMLIPTPPKFRRHRGQIKAPTAAPPPPVAVLLTAVHVQQAGDTLEFVFDSDIVAADGAYQCTLDGEPVFFDSIDSFSGGSIIVYFGQDVSAATVGTLISGGGIVFA